MTMVHTNPIKHASLSKHQDRPSPPPIPFCIEFQPSTAQTTQDDSNNALLSISDENLHDLTGLAGILQCFQSQNDALDNKLANEASHTLLGMRRSHVRVKSVHQNAAWDELTHSSLPSFLPSEGQEGLKGLEGFTEDDLNEPLNLLNPLKHTNSKPFKSIKSRLLFGNENHMSCLNAEAASGAAMMGRDMLRALK